MTLKNATIVLCLLCAIPSFARKKQAPKPAHHPKEAVVAPPPPTPAAPKPAPRATTEPAAKGAGASHDVVQRESKIEFDERLVQGQTASGAIYLFQRGESEFQSMVHLPSSFRDRTVEKVLGEARR